MNQHAKLTLVNQHLQRLLSMRDPSNVDGWQPAEMQRAIYAGLLKRILDGYDEIKSFEKHQVLREGAVQRYFSAESLDYFRREVEPRIADLKHAFKLVDPDGAELYELLEGLTAPSGAGDRVRETFEAGLEQVYDLIDRNPDQKYGFLPDTAVELMDSKLIAFKPDLWLDRAGHIDPIRTDTAGVLLPAHVRLRLEELFRAYVFGCWLSVLALSRAVLEYAVADNFGKFGLDPNWSSADKRKGRKNLEALISELGHQLPSLVPLMEKLRSYGNHYLHPRALSEETLFRREKAAREALETLVKVVEGLYLAAGRRP